MAKIYFKFGVMGSSKSANALMTKFDYEQKGMKVALMKPLVDTRDGANIIKSRIGLESTAISFNDEFDFIWDTGFKNYDCIIVDECQFCTTSQIEELKHIASFYNVTVLCYGLKTDFQSHLFEGSKRLLELADSIEEIKCMCKCGNKAIINAKFDMNGKLLIEGRQIDIGGNEKYKAICYKCWIKSQNEQGEELNE